MFLEKNKCTGCMACKNACPRNAIIEEENEEGFKYPEIIEEYCINCNLCQYACPVFHKKEEVEKDIISYACKNKDEEVRMNSSSGGVFSLIANYIIDSGGTVYGVAFNKNFETEHIRVDSKDELEKLRGSKYIQSNINSIYRQARNDLEEGRMVLFTGTPCQVEGFKSLLGKDYDNLYLQDIICHGIPSKKAFKKYLEFKEKQVGEINYFSFRDKKNNGWNRYQVHISGNKSEEYVDHSLDSFMNIFLSDIALRESCYDCDFKKKHRISDITLADFWGINDVCPEMNDEKGTSLVIIHSNKGKDLLSKIESKLEWKQVDIDDAIKHNPSMIKSAPNNERREEFFKDLDNLDYEQLVDKYLKK